MNVADQIADWLANVGIEQVFTVTGGGSMFLNQAFGRHSRLNCTFMHHEQACAMAAEGYARMKCKPAVVLITTGPGAINAMNGVFGAFTDSIPMIVISGQVKRETCMSCHDSVKLRQLGDQEAPVVAMVSPICKAAHFIEDENSLSDLLPTLYNTAIHGRPGPVWLDIPLDIQNSQIDLKLVERPEWDQWLPYEPDRCFDELIDRLLKCHRPLILAGTGVRLAGARDDLLEMAEEFSLPIATAWTHDLIPSDHPLFVGRPGTIGTRPGNICLQNSDFLLVLGSRLNVRQISYSWSIFAKNAWVAQVDIDRSELAKPTYVANAVIHADIKDFLKALNQRLHDYTIPDFSPWVDWCKRIGEVFSIEREHHQSNKNQINPYIAVREIFDAAEGGEAFVCGNASACIIPFQIGFLRKNQRMFSNSGAASMGYELPAAIGAAMASEGRRIICFAGDGSLQMNIQELQTLKSLELNIIIIVINNGGYLSIRQTHENFFQTVIGATPASGVEFPDYLKLARAYGIQAEAIDSPSDLGRLSQLMRNPGPYLLDIRVDPTQNFEPKLKSRVDELGEFQTPELDDMHPFIPRVALDALRSEAAQIRALTK